jgi:large subunit ribosomal protein L15
VASTSPTSLHYAVVNLGLIQKFVDAGKLDAKSEITEDALVAAGVTSRKLDGVRVLAKGEIKAKLNIDRDRRFGCRGREGWWQRPVAR